MKVYKSLFEKEWEAAGGLHLIKEVNRLYHI